MSSVNTHSITFALGIWNQQSCFSHASQFLTLYMPVLFYEIWIVAFFLFRLVQYVISHWDSWSCLSSHPFEIWKLYHKCWLPHIHMCVHIPCLKPKLHTLICQGKGELISFNYGHHIFLSPWGFVVPNQHIMLISLSYHYGVWVLLFLSHQLAHILPSPPGTEATCFPGYVPIQLPCNDLFLEERDHIS